MRRFTLIFYPRVPGRNHEFRTTPSAIALVDARDPDHARYIARDLKPTPRDTVAIELGDTRARHPGAQEILPSDVPANGEKG